jgi:hypothetical protein
MAKLALSVAESAEAAQNVVTEDSVDVTETSEIVTEVADPVTEVTSAVQGVLEVVPTATEAVTAAAVTNSTAAFEGDELKPFMWHVTHLDNGQAKFRNTTTGRVFVGSTAEFTAKLRG